MTDLLTIWRAGRVRRWHVNPHLSHTNDCDDGHSFRVTVMALFFKPDLSRDAIISALAHDLGEYATGDISYMVKIENPSLAADIDKIEREVIRRLGFSTPKLDLYDEKLIKLCDWTDAWLWMAHHTPELKTRSDWVMQKNNAFNLARELGLGCTYAEALSSIMTEVEARK